MFVDGLTLHAGTAATVETLMGALVFRRWRMAFSMARRLSLETASRWLARPCSALSDGGGGGDDSSRSTGVGFAEYGFVASAAGYRGLDTPRSAPPNLTALSYMKDI